MGNRQQKGFNGGNKRIMLITIAILLVLLFILWQDWNFRQIHVLLPIAIFSAALIKLYPTLNFSYVGFNAFFFLAVFGLLVLYMSLKARKFLNPFEHYFGLGDVLFYLAITPYFQLKNYAVFFIASMLFALLLHLFVNKFYKLHHVPLAGYAALLLVLVIVVDLSGKFNKITLL